MKPHLLSVVTALLLVVFPTFAQTGIKVRVSDASGPLGGAVVAVKDSDIAGVTDLDGAVTLADIPQNSTLVISMLGYQTKEIPAGSQPVIDVVLEESTEYLDELVFIGYGTQKKRDLTGSVTNVKMSEIADAPVTSVDQALQGRVAGADIMSTTG